MTQPDSLTDAAPGLLTCSPTTQPAAAAASVMATPRCAPRLPGSRNTTSSQTSAMVIVHEVCLPGVGSLALTGNLTLEVGMGTATALPLYPLWKDAYAPQPWCVGWEREPSGTCCYPGGAPTSTPSASGLSSGGTGKLGIAAGLLSLVGEPPFNPRRVSFLSISEFQLRLLSFIY